MYLSGPCSGYAECNELAFNAAEKLLRSKGCQVINPVAGELDLPLFRQMDKNSADYFEVNDNLARGIVPDELWLECMERGIRMLAQCDAIYLLPDWERSFGSQIEYLIACRLKKLIIHHEPWQYVHEEGE